MTFNVSVNNGTPLNYTEDELVERYLKNCDRELLTHPIFSHHILIADVNVNIVPVREDN